MSGKKMERSVEDAELATGGLVLEQRRRVEVAIPVRLPDAEQRLDASTAAAMQATASLGAQSDRVRSFLAGALRQGPARRMSAEDLFSEAARGFEQPARVFTTTDEARADSEGFMRRGFDTVPGLSAAPEVPGAAEYRDSHQEDVGAISRDVSGGWMTRDFLGETVFSRFSRSPPVATLETGGWFATVSAASGNPTGGMYEAGTNHVFVSLYQGDNAYLMMAHEQLHYAAYLGGGGATRWRDGDGNPHLREEGWAVHEGMTELLAQGLARSHGRVPSGVAYTFETSVCFAMQQVVGEEPLRRAYLSGDFTQVRTLLDVRLGAGSFDGLMACRSGADAFSFIMGKASAAGIDYAGWESSPIMAQCYAQMAIERFR